MASADHRLRSRLAAEARDEGYDVVTGGSARIALRHAELSPIALAVIDEPLSDLPADDLVAALAARGCASLVICSSWDEAHVLSLLEIGADDVVGRPFSALELRARIHAILRRRSPRPRTYPDELVVGQIVLHVMQRCVTVRGGLRLPVRRVDFAVLLALHARNGAPVPVGVLLDQCWPLSASRRPENVPPVIGRLRRLIEQDPARPQLLLTIRGLGYALRA